MKGRVTHAVPKTTVFPDEGGPATEALCKGFEDIINNSNRLASDALDEGNVDEAITWAEYSDMKADQALDAGCIVLF